MATYSKEELTKLQNTLKAILFEIDKICKKHNISYFAIAGTLLGAVRHSDIIPWDDDIDIGMLRDDYEKFLKVAQSELPNDLFCLNYPTYKDVPASFTKICKKGTLFVEYETRNLKYPHCVFVDIMPCDLLPVDEKKRHKQLRKIRFYHELYKTKSLWKVSSISSKKKRIIGNVLRPILRILLLPFSKKMIFKKLKKVSMKYNDLSTNSYIAYKGKESTTHPYSRLYPLVVLKFGSLDIPAPNGYDAMLTKSYGDYMSLPPQNKRVSHIPYQFKI